MAEDEWDAIIKVHLKGILSRERAGAALCATSTRRQEGGRAHRQNQLRRRAAGQRRASNYARQGRYRPR